ncbi:hypothetical protein Harman_24100 [Haloarcula mannanilytica]|uniref:Uncharacterized protein n=1 Tax=Haloarcula mannanilytica TaxID=2509225 RepID=A0A4C2EJC1_9EURY|nr:hypothetical protein [Haloarcula mannanilytica]GCF14475.1 hypothetical protein Harman_24100 [Haloarcula mannanilytica]
MPPDSRIADSYASRGYLSTISPVSASRSRSPIYSRLQENSNLSDADAAVLAYADAHDGVAVMDETYGRDVAVAEGSPPGALYFSS